MHTITGHVRRPPAACWKVLVDPTLLTSWVPGLRRARVIESYETGLPKEIHFEFSSSLTYSLVYTYDVPAHEMRWEPRMGQRDGVAGFAKIDETEDGARLTYGLEPGAGRSEKDRALGDPESLVREFVTWMHAY